MIKEGKYYELSYYDKDWGKWLYIRYEMGELAKVVQFITKRRIVEYRLNIVEIKLHKVELGVIG